jgi:hypothetical protein
MIDAVSVISASLSSVLSVLSFYCPFSHIDADEQYIQASQPISVSFLTAQMHNLWFFV